MTMGTTGGSNRKGFASMDPDRRREVSARGGQRAHELHKAHRWTREEAAQAGRKGGVVRREKSRG